MALCLWSKIHTFIFTLAVGVGLSSRTIVQVHAILRAVVVPLRT